MRLLIADKLHPRAIEELRTLPIEVVYDPEVTKDSLEKKLPGFGILIVRSTEVTQAAVEAARQLHLIVRAGAAYNTIDVRAASKRGIYVANCPGKNAAAVAELVMGMLVCLDRRIPDAMASLRARVSGSARSTARPRGCTARRSASRGSGPSARSSCTARRRSGCTSSATADRSRPRARRTSASRTRPPSRTSRSAPTSCRSTSRARRAHPPDHQQEGARSPASSAPCW